MLEVLDQTGETQVIDLGSGGGGPVLQVQQNLNLHNKPITFILTDKFPNPDAWRYLQEKTKGQVSFYPDSVDAENVPAGLNGVRTLFSAAHHFRPEQIKAILKAAVAQRQAICLFDGGDKNWFFLLGSLIVHPVVFFFARLFCVLLKFPGCCSLISFRSFPSQLFGMVVFHFYVCTSRMNF